jgi:O-antigen/teichoic acid export membrane protein
VPAAADRPAGRTQVRPIPTLIPVAVRGAAWSGLEAASAACLSMVSAFVVARLIGPDELGTGAAAVSVHVLLWVTVNALFGDALVQRETLDDLMVASALTTSVGVGCLAAMIQAAAGWGLVASFDDPRLWHMALWLAVPLPLVGAAGVSQGLLTRARGYRELAGRTIVGQGLGTLTGVACALAGMGAWAVVIQQVVTSMVGALALLARTEWCAGGHLMMPQDAPWQDTAMGRWRGSLRRVRRSFRWAWPQVRALLKVGGPLTVSTLVLHARYRMFALLIGGTAGAHALGQVHVAFRLVDSVRELCFTALWRLMLPVLSERQGDKAALLGGVDRLLAHASLITLPLCGAMAVALPPLVPLLLGAQWPSIGVISEPLIGLMAMLSVTFPAGVALVAAGRAHAALVANLAGIATILLAVILIEPADAWQAVLVWCGGQIAIMPYLLWLNGRTLGVGPLRPLRAAVPMVLVTIVATSVAILLPALLFPSPLAGLPLILARLLIGALCAGGGVVVVLRRQLFRAMSPITGR